VPGHGLAERQAGRVGADAGDQAATRAGLLERGPAVVVEPDPRRDLGRLPGDGAGEPDDRGPAGGGAGQQPVDHGLEAQAGRRGRTHRGIDRTRRGIDTRWLPGRVDDGDQVPRVAGDPGIRVARAGGGRVAGVGQPVQPAPGRAGGGSGGSGGEDPEVVGSVEGGELADDRPGEGPDPVGWAGEGEDPDLAQREGHRGIWEPAGSADKVRRGRGQLRVVLDQGPGGFEPDRGGQRDRAAADPDGEEVVVGRAALPEAVGPGDRGPQPRRVGVEVLGGGELGRGLPLGRRRDLGEVGQVAGALAAAGPAGGPALGQAEGQPDRDRGAGRGDHQADQPAGPGAGDGEQERDRPAAADQRHQVLEPAGEAGGCPGDRRRGRHRQLAPRRRPRMGPHRPVHQRAGRSRAGVPRTGREAVRGGRGRHVRHATAPARSLGRPPARLWTTGAGATLRAA
jgi:hypothetical protein